MDAPLRSALSLPPADSIQRGVQEPAIRWRNCFCGRAGGAADSISKGQEPIPEHPDRARGRSWGEPRRAWRKDPRIFHLQLNSACSVDLSLWRGEIREIRQ